MRRNLKNTYISPVDYAQAEENGISKELLRNRIWGQGWNKTKAKTQPVREKLFDHGGWAKVALENGISRNTFYGRINRGWEDEKAATTPVGKKGRPRKEK